MYDSNYFRKIIGENVNPNDYFENSSNISNSSARIIDENTYMISGSMPIYEVEKILDTEISEGDYDTLSGYLLEQLGRIPAEKEKPTIETEEIVFKIEKVSDKRIIKVKACKISKEEE